MRLELATTLSWPEFNYVFFLNFANVENIKPETSFMRSTTERAGTWVYKMNFPFLLGLFYGLGQFMKKKCLLHMFNVPDFGLNPHLDTS